ncbi:cache domain-containing sensor histidine kinase [Noviherbaspirillum aridicola]|uniref:Histidine kinase domain-containing protein n=1 Tax=Noviherbaspirillum aridicola TaxID=2849687 RepID=A0ABQ4Q6I2_9BURK|nr:histidine kinase [Noviherbaspirillum aridicola]GIZ52831.1 hypothetical protein NCCP691_28450 [Noviherbaspirillum aridicola]
MFRRYHTSLQIRDWRLPIAVACCCALLIALIWQGLLHKFERERLQAFAHARQRNDNLAAAFEGYVTHVINMAEAGSRLVGQGYAQHGARTDIDAMLRARLLDPAVFAAVEIIDGHGRVVQSSHRHRIGMAAGEAEYFRVHATDARLELQISRPVAIHGDGRLTIAFTRRINDGDGSFAGVVALHAEPSRFTGFYRDASLREGDVLALAGLDGTLRVRRRGESISAGADVSDTPILRMLHERARGTHVGPTPLDGVRRHFSYRRLQDYPLVAIVGVAEQDILAPLDAMHAGEMREAALATLLIALFGGGISAAWLRQAQTLHRLRESELRFAASAANIPGMAFQLRAAPQGGSFVFVSERAQEVCGISAERIVADSDAFFGLIHPAHGYGFRETMACSLNGMQDWNWEGRLLTGPDGEEKWINLRARPRAAGRLGVVWDGVIFNITRSKRHEENLQQARARLQQLSAHQTAIKDEERKRIAREIHDELGQRLTVLRMDVMMLPRTVATHPAALREGVEQMRAAIDDILRIVRDIASELRPAVLDIGIVEAIEWLMDEFRASLGIACGFRNLAGDVSLDEERATGVFRVLQESMTNAARHAGAGRIDVVLSRGAGMLWLEVRDDGTGFRAEDVRKGSWGLAGMRERAAMMHGELTVVSAPGEGVRVRLGIPDATEVEEQA